MPIPTAPVYLDYAASAPMLPEAIDAWVAAAREIGNPSSIHAQGQRQKMAVEAARDAVAASVGADAVEVLFTGGGTEAVNAGIKGLWWQRQADGAGVQGRRDRPRPRILVPLGEHYATLDSVQWLEAAQGAQVRWLPIDATGVVSIEALEQELSSGGGEVALVTLMLANNEVGTVQPVRRVARLAHAHGVPVHVDAIAAYGQLPIDFGGPRGLGVDALSLSAHKIGGPVGAGALVVARGASVVPLLHGGGQQRRLRSGTLDAPAAAAFAAAARVAADGLEPHAARLAALRDRMIAGVRSVDPPAVLRGPEPGAVLDDDGVAVPARLPGNVHFTFPGTQGDSLLYLLDASGFSVSTGSACQAGVPEISHVLTGMGLTDADAVGALRMTLGATTTETVVDAFVAALAGVLPRARAAGLS